MTRPTFHLAKRDAIEWLESLPGESVDLVITDPAYESLEKHRKVGTTTRLKKSDASSNEWFSIFPNARFPRFFAEVYRVLRADRHFYMYCDQETMFVTKPMAEAAGFTFHKPIVWDKVSIGMGYHYRARYEFILFFEKGYRKLADLGVPDVITHKRITGWSCDSCLGSTPRDIGRSASVVDGESNTTSSGRAPTGQSRRDSRSTTRTKTSSTTDSITSSSSIRPRTSGSTQDASSVTACGGSRAESVDSSSPSPQSIGTSIRMDDGQSSEHADRATSALSSRESNGSERSACPVCGADRRRAWPTEKPSGVSAVLIDQSTRPGELVIDPFMGSGSVGYAAVTRGRHFFGGDVADASHQLARARLADHATETMELPPRADGQLGMAIR